MGHLEVPPDNSRHPGIQISLDTFGFVLLLTTSTASLTPTFSKVIEEGKITCQVRQELNAPQVWTQTRMSVWVVRAGFNPFSVSCSIQVGSGISASTFALHAST